MVIVSCSTKFHAFDLSEQLAQNGILTGLYTTFHSQKNNIIGQLHHRKDQERIPLDKIRTCVLLAICLRKFPNNEYKWNDIFDHYVKWSLTNQKNYKVFIGWSGMSLNALLYAKSKNKITIIERGSSHILYQKEILQEEYSRQLGQDVNFDSRVIEKELKEYEAADFISIPSLFVKRSFIEYGVPESKLFYNPYGTSSSFYPKTINRDNDKFRILYLGSLNIRKGLIYLFEALNQLELKEKDYEVWFIGGMDSNIKPFYDKYSKSNWKYLGFIEHYELVNYITQCDIAIQPSIEEGLSRVIPQILSCGVPVIATYNSGGEEVITDDKTGFLIPIRDSGIISRKIEHLYYDRNKLNSMKIDASKSANQDLSWDKYGKRYANFLQKNTL